MTVLAVGDQVPDFTLPSTRGAFILREYEGNFVVLYFYPKDNTPGCTTEAQGFRNQYPEFNALNTSIFGVSRDSVESHLKFKEQQQLPFDLIADVDQTACRMFGVLDETSSLNKDTCSMVRTTFVIDRHGKLIKEWRKVKVTGHVAEVLKFIYEQQ